MTMGRKRARDITQFKNPQRGYYYSNYVGVTYNKAKRTNHWQAYYYRNHKTHSLGYYATELEAARVREDYLNAHSIPAKRNFKEGQKMITHKMGRSPSLARHFNKFHDRIVDTIRQAGDDGISLSNLARVMNVQEHALRSNLPGLLKKGVIEKHHNLLHYFINEDEPQVIEVTVPAVNLNEINVVPEASMEKRVSDLEQFKTHIDNVLESLGLQWKVST